MAGPAAAAASLTYTALWPFAVLSEVVAAGVFSVINTTLNLIVLIYLTRTRQRVEQVAAVTDKVKLRRGDRENPDSHPAELRDPPEWKWPPR